MKDFLSTFSVENEERREIAMLLDGMKYINYTFTSCAFFSDISGLEPRDDIKYALQSVTKFQNYSDSILMIDFLNDLRKDKSNIRSFHSTE